MLKRPLLAPGALLLILIVAGLFVGCAGGVRSNVVITSEPTDAIVTWDGYERGGTPIDIPFIWYWHHDIELRKEGYEPLRVTERLRAKPWLIFPIDGVVELLPFPIHDTRTFHYKMTPVAESAE